METGIALRLSCGSWINTATGGDTVEIEKGEIFLLLLPPVLLSPTTAYHWPGKKSLGDAALRVQPLRYRAGQSKGRASKSRTQSSHGSWPAPWSHQPARREGIVL